MANSLFKDMNVSNKPSRNGFDLSRRVKFTAKAGELLPVFHEKMMIGDKVRINLKHFSRTAPVVSPAFTQIREYYDVFFVPYRLLNRNIPNILASNTQNPTIATSLTSNRQIGTQLPQFDSSVVFRSIGQALLKGSDAGILSTLSVRENQFGFNRGYLSAKLLNHLGYGFISDADFTEYYDVNSASGEVSPESPVSVQPRLSILPIAAYNKIYYDFFRLSQWEDNQPYNYNFDYLGQDAFVDLESLLNTSEGSTLFDNPTMFDLRYSNYPKDLFFGVLPESQYGDEAVVEVDASATTSDKFAPLQTEDGSESTINAESGILHTASGGYVNTDSILGVNVRSAITNLKASFSVLAERKARFLQKYREIIGSGSVDYQNIVRKVFGVDVPDDLADHCYYLGGQSFDIKINEVENTNLAGDNEANLKGKGVGSGDSSVIDFECKEPGIIMCIYHAQPIIDYALSAFHFDVTKTEVDDFANPIFDRLGFQPLPAMYLNVDLRGAKTQEIYNARVANYMDAELGYTTRYFDYKTAVDTVLGDFRGTMSHWLSPVNFDYLQNFINDTGVVAINSNFFKVNPHILDSIFKVEATEKVNTDQIYISCSVEMHVVRNLDYNGLPY